MRTRNASCGASIARGGRSDGEPTMLRRLMSRLLGADLEPNVAWQDIDAMKIEARVLTEAPRFLRRPEPLEQVLCTSADRYVMFKKAHRSGWVMRLSFPR